VTVSVFMFPNFVGFAQGMGAELFARQPVVTRRMSELLGYDIEAIARDNPDGKLYLGRYAQGIVFCANALALWARLDGPHAPAWVVGHSMGELNAMHASGMIAIEDLLAWIRLTADEPVYQRDADSGLAVIHGVPAETVARVIAEHQLDVVIACDNSIQHVVVGGRREALERAQSVFRARRDVGIYATLRGDFAFHCHPDHAFREPAQRALLERMTLRAPRVPFFSSILCRPVESADDARTILCTVPFARVRWRETIAALHACGARTFEQVGFGTSLPSIVAVTLAALSPAAPATGTAPVAPS